VSEDWLQSDLCCNVWKSFRRLGCCFGKEGSPELCWRYELDVVEVQLVLGRVAAQVTSITTTFIVGSDYRTRV
jgi:hypothetical protein